MSVSAVIMGKVYPFKFLDSYGKDDTGLFFGRDKEIADLYKMIFESNILMVYGASGTGKTSLIVCGLASKFQPHDWLALYIRRGGDLNKSFDKAVADAGKLAANTDLETTFKAIYRNSFRPLYLIFDQFEELFILGNKKEQTDFFDTVSAVLNLEQPVKLIFSIREEYIGRLYDFEKEVPQLMRNKLHVESMDFGKVKEVITGAAKVPGSVISLKAGEEEGIALSIFTKLGGKDKSDTIQLPYLQVFLDKVYNTTIGDKPRGSDAVFTKALIDGTPPIGDILGDFLESQVKAISETLKVDDKLVAAEEIWVILSPFATLQGTKAPKSMNSLFAALSNEPNAKLIKATVSALITGRILKDKDKDDVYELMHDSLAGKIASKRSSEDREKLEVTKLIEDRVNQKEEDREFFSEKQLLRIDAVMKSLPAIAGARELINDSKAAIKAQKDKQKRRLKRTIALMAGVVILTSSLAIWAFRKSAEAGRKTQSAQSLALSSQSNTEIYKNRDYTKGLIYAQYALQKDPTNVNAIIGIYKTIFQPADQPVRLFYNEVLRNANTASNYLVSADGSKVFFIGPENSLNIVDINDNYKHAVIPVDSTRAIMAHTGCGWSLSYGLSPDGNILMVDEEYGERSTYFIDVHTGKRLLYKDNPGVAGFEAERSDDSVRYELAYSEAEQGPSVFFSSGNSKILFTKMSHTQVVDSVQTYQGVKDYFYYYAIQSINVFDSKSRRFTDSFLLTKNTRKINSVVFSEDAKRVFVYSSGHFNNSLQIFSIQTGKELKEFRVRKTDSIYFTFSNDSKQIAVRCAGEPVSVFDVASMKRISLTDTVVRSFALRSTRMIFNSDRTTLALIDFVAGNKVNIKDDASITHFGPGRKKIVFDGVILSKDEKRLLTQKFVSRYVEINKNGEMGWVKDSLIRTSLWDAKTGGKITDIELPNSIDAYGFNSALLQLSPDGKYILTTLNETANLWNDKGRQEAVLSGHKSNIRKAEFSKDGKSIITCSENESVKKWSLDRILDLRLNNTADGCRSSDFIGEKENSPPILHSYQVILPEKRIISIDGSSSIKIVDSLTRKEIYSYTLKESKASCHHYKISPNGRYLLAIIQFPAEDEGQPDGYSILFDIKNYGVIGTYKLTNGVFSANSRYLLLSNWDNECELIDAFYGIELANINIPVDTALYNSAAIFSFSNDNKMLMAKYRTNRNDSTYEYMDSTLKGWFIDPFEIMNKMKDRIPDLSPEEKAKYGITEKK